MYLLGASSHYFSSLFYNAKLTDCGFFRKANVLIDDEGHAVIADYGLVFVIETTDFTSTKTAGTCRWMAPEVMNPEEEQEEDLDSQEPAVLFTTYSDIYAFAMTVFEVKNVFDKLESWLIYAQ
jgi:serine/threonine protein kinase